MVRSIADSKRAKDTVVASMYIWALNTHGAKKVAAIIDTSKPEIPGLPKQRETNGQLSYPEMVWAKGEMEKLDRDEGVFATKVPEEERAEFRKHFEELYAFFHDPMKHLEMIRRAPLIVGEKQYCDVFEISNKCDLERDLTTMLRAGYDVIGVRDPHKKKTYVALNHNGALKRVGRGTEGVMKTPYFDQVKVVFAEDINNGFWEGVSLIPRAIAELLSNLFSRGKNRVLSEGHKPEELGEKITEVAQFVTPASIAMPDKDGPQVPGLILAVAIGLGAVNLTQIVAAAPEAGIVIGGLATVGTIYNAIFGKFFRRQDPYFVLNFAGVQLAHKNTVREYEDPNFKGQCADL
jgi:hypothetical protein